MEEGAEDEVEVVTGCSSKDRRSMAVVFYDTRGWLLISCHSRRENKAGRKYVDALEQRYIRS
jgi:hypothetical protein